jgi:hypothetical protein
MTDKQWVRLTALAGVAFVILIIVQGPVLGGSPPSLTDSGQKVLDFVTKHRTHLKASSTLYALAMPAVLVWATGLFAALRKAEGGTPGWAVTGLIGTVLAAAMTVTTAAIQGAMALRSADLSAATASVLYAVEQFLQSGILFGLMLGMAAIAVVCLTKDLFAKWVGWVAGLLAIGSVVGAFGLGYASLQPATGIMLSLDTLLILVISVLMWRDPEVALA